MGGGLEALVIEGQNKPLEGGSGRGRNEALAMRLNVKQGVADAEQVVGRSPGGSTPSASSCWASGRRRTTFSPQEPTSWPHYLVAAR